MSKFWSFFTNHTHYWSRPYTRAADNRLIQTCYECSKDRECLVDIRPTLEAVQ